MSLRKLFLLLGLVCFTQAGATPPLVTVAGGRLAPFWLKPKKAGVRKAYLISDLRVQSYQVTNENFISFLKTHPEWKKGTASSLYTDASYLSQFSSDMTLKNDVLLQAPVTNVSWFAAQAYCKSLGLRLPTILEWEYLAAADEKIDFAYTNPLFLKRILEWYGQTQEALKPVMSLYKNKYGLYDMHGLVWEWVQDFNSSFMTGESREDSSFDRNLFCGAGSLSQGDKENYASYMRFAFRSSLSGKSSIWNLGFRCVKEIQK